MHERFLTKREKIFGLSLLILLCLLFLINSIVSSSTKSYIFKTDKIGSIPKADAILILGAAVYKNGALTPVLYDRAVTALELYKNGKAEKILISGDNSRLDHNEVIPVSKFLIGQGVPSEAIFLDYAGFDTYDSMYRARDIFKVKSLIIVTQEFHLPRSVYIARNLGIDAVGFSADKREYFARNSVREFFATVKAFFDVTFGSKPKYLGEPVPINSESGNVPVQTSTTTSIK